MRELNKLKQELMILKTNNIRPNYSELARLHDCDRRTIKNIMKDMLASQKQEIKVLG